MNIYLFNFSVLWNITFSRMKFWRLSRSTLSILFIAYQIMYTHCFVLFFSQRGRKRDLLLGLPWASHDRDLTLSKYHSDHATLWNCKSALFTLHVSSWNSYRSFFFQSQGAYQQIFLLHESLCGKFPPLFLIFPLQFGHTRAPPVCATVNHKPTTVIWS